MQLLFVTKHDIINYYMRSKTLKKKTVLGHVQSDATTSSRMGVTSYNAS